MKRTLIIFSLTIMSLGMVAQPPARLRQQAASQDTKSKTQSPTTTLSERAALEFPTSGAMPEDVAWRRDVYKVLDLSKDRNAVLYYPEEPQGDQMNLFTYLFKLVLRKQVKAYEYTIDGNEHFTDKNAMKPTVILTRFEIPHETNGDKVRVEDADIPSAQVKSYYIKETTFYDQNTAQFQTRVTAICPVRRNIGEFGEYGEEAPTPLFWLDYAEVSPYLAKLTVMNSNYNNASKISANDYFTLNQYEGKIYKTVNLQGKVLANYCETDSDLVKEQTRIEKEIRTLQDHVWGIDSAKIKAKAKADSILAAQQDSIAKSGKPARTSQKKQSKTESQSTSSRSQLKREQSNGTSNSATKPRFSARRQRH
ncbi:MAG: gliding motility protein GldN [Prevotellaceae bacterium]|nr:gliding motility protein GldN [Prevotellaceae bacterium]